VTKVTSLAAFAKRARAKARGEDIPLDAPPPPVLAPLGDDGLPTGTCATCGEGGFHRAPGGPWTCTTCSPPEYDDELQAEWSFCWTQGSLRAVLPYPFPPGWPGFPGEDTLEIEIPPLDAPSGKCRACGFLAPMSSNHLCAPCERADAIGRHTAPVE
jgi:hypothetical protein